MRIWLVTWEAIDDRVVSKSKVAALLNGTYPKERVGELLELLYANAQLTLQERLTYAQTQHTPYHTEFTGPEHLVCGHDPFLEARLVDHVSVSTQDGSELLTYDGPLL